VRFSLLIPDRCVVLCYVVPLCVLRRVAGVARRAGGWAVGRLVRSRYHEFVFFLLLHFDSLFASSGFVPFSFLSALHCIYVVVLCINIKSLIPNLYLTRETGQVKGARRLGKVRMADQPVPFFTYVLSP
jgi:hypothetical protein